MQSTPQKGDQKVPAVTTSPGQTPIKSPEMKKPKGQDRNELPKEVEPTLVEEIEERFLWFVSGCLSGARASPWCAEWRMRRHWKSGSPRYTLAA